MPSKIRGGTKDKHLADMHIPRVSALGAGGGAAAAFDPSSVASYSRDWNFADITKLYKDTAHTLAVTADADPIGAILDTAGSGVYLTAGADATRPTYKTNIQNGQAVGRWDGSDDYLTNATAITADASQTIFIVAQKRSAVAAANKQLFSITANMQVYTNSTGASPTGYSLWQGTSSAIGGTPTNWNILVFKYTGVDSFAVYLNGGAAVLSGNPDDNYATATSVFLCVAPDTASDGDYDIGRVLIYSAALSNANLDYIIGGLGTLWGITTSAVS